jgi:transcriptional regulator with XRE-family HTH domain
MGKSESAASLLRDLRRRQGHSLRSAAAELGIAPSQLSRMERGERAVGEKTAERLSAYYAVPAEVIDLARGQAPADIVTILQDHPEEIARLREKYAG